MSVRDLFGGASGTYTLPAQGGSSGQVLAYPSSLTAGRNELQWITPSGSSVADVWKYETGATPVICPNSANPGYSVPSDFAVPAGVTSLSGIGTRMTFSHSGDIRAGSVSGAQWDVRGDQSAAFGRDNYAQGAQSFACGSANAAAGPQSFVAGTSNSVDGTSNHSCVLGGNTNVVSASQNSGILTGFNNTVEADATGNTVITAGASNYASASNGAIIAGTSQQLSETHSSAIVAGTANLMQNSINSAVVTGASATMGAVSNSAVLCGSENTIPTGSDRCSILCGSSITATTGQTDTAYAQRLATTGGRQKAIRLISSTPQTLSLDDHIIAFSNTSGGAFSVLLPASPVNGQEYWIKVIACAVNSTIDCGSSHYFQLPDGSLTQTLPILTTAVGRSTHVVFSATIVLGGRTGIWLVLGTAETAIPAFGQITAFPMFNVLPVASWSGTSLTYTSGTYTLAVSTEYNSTFKGAFASQATKTSAQWASNGANPNPASLTITRTTYEPVKYVSMIGRLGFGTEAPKTFQAAALVDGIWRAILNADGTSSTMNMLQEIAGYTPVAGFVIPDDFMGFSSLFIEFTTVQTGCTNMGLSNISLFSPQQTQQGNPWSLYQSQVPYSTVWTGSTTYPYSFLQGIGGYSFYTLEAGWYSIQASIGLAGNASGAANIFMYVDGSAAMNSSPTGYLSLSVSTTHTAAPTIYSTVNLQPGLHTITFSSWTTNLPSPTTTYMATPTAHAFCQAEDQVNISITKVVR